MEVRLARARALRARAVRARDIESQNNGQTQWGPELERE